MLSVSFFCTRKQNLMEILGAYKDVPEISEILVVSLDRIEIKNKPNKIKLIHMPKDSDLGLLSRYTFALSCKNRYVFIQDDDWVYEPEMLIRLLIYKSLWQDAIQDGFMTVFTKNNLSLKLIQHLYC